MSEEKEAVKKKAPEKKAKPSMPKGLKLEYREISIPLEAIPTREAFDKLFKGQLIRTDINLAWKEAEKLRAKYN